MTGKLFRIFFKRNYLFFISEMNSVLTFYMKRTGLTSFINIIIITVNLYIPGEKQMKFFTLCQCRSGIDTMTVIRRIRIKSCPFVFPVYQIFACIMSPEFQSAFHIKGSVLKKHMISAFIPA